MNALPESETHSSPLTQKLSRFTPLLLLMFAVLLGGCGDITGRGPAPLDRTVDTAQRELHARVGYVYCMRGWLGIFSTGMDSLAQKIDTQMSTPAVSVADEEWHRLQDWLIQQHDEGHLNEGPLILLGHSYGADDQIRVAETLKEHGMTVDLLVLIDPVTPPPVPDNVKRVYCVYYSHPLTDFYPAWRGVPAEVADPTKTPITNIDLRLTDVGFDTTVINHVNIEKVAGVHDMVMKQIEMVCPPRTAWLQTHPENANSITQSLSPAAPIGEPAIPLTAGKPVKPTVATP